MSDKRLEQIQQKANECFPDDRDVDKYTGFIFGAMWADSYCPERDNEWHDVNDKVDPTKVCIDKSNVIMYIDGNRDIYTTSIGIIEDVCHTFENFVNICNVRYWTYARAFIPYTIYDKLFQEAMEKNHDKE